MNARHVNPREGGPTFSFRNRLERGLWSVVWHAFGIWTPVPFYSWRRFLLRLFGAKVARSAKIYPGVEVWYPRNLRMSPYSCLGRGVVCYSMARVMLEPYALVSQRAHLCCGTHDLDDLDFQLKAKPICIGRNAWVAAEAFVGPGVTLAEGAVLGARGCSFRDLDSWAVYVGNPAHKVRERRRS